MRVRRVDASPSTFGGAVPVVDGTASPDARATGLPSCSGTALAWASSTRWPVLPAAARSAPCGTDSARENLVGLLWRPPHRAEMNQRQLAIGGPRGAAGGLGAVGVACGLAA